MYHAAWMFLWVVYSGCLIWIFRSTYQTAQKIQQYPDAIPSYEMRQLVRAALRNACIFGGTSILFVAMILQVPLT